SINNASYPWFTSLNITNTLKEVEALDANTVKFTLTRPDNTFLANISTAHAVVLSAEYAQQLQASNQLANIDTHPVGTGPFYLDEYQPLD
ncbi:ABC transporter substrate-binding protein, partial [Bacillus cereus group sp. Bce031]